MNFLINRLLYIFGAFHYSTLDNKSKKGLFVILSVAKITIKNNTTDVFTNIPTIYLELHTSSLKYKLESSS
jgi:hypothetical protein